METQKKLSHSKMTLWQKATVCQSWSTVESFKFHIFTIFLKAEQFAWAICLIYNVSVRCCFVFTTSKKNTAHLAKQLQNSFYALLWWISINYQGCFTSNKWKWWFITWSMHCSPVAKTSRKFRNKTASDNQMLNVSYIYIFSSISQSIHCHLFDSQSIGTWIFLFSHDFSLRRDM